MSKSVTRNNNIDVLKVVLSLFVVAAHIFPTTAIEGKKSYLFFIIQGFARTTVPLFLLFTGYFISNRINDFAFLLKNAKKLFILFLVWQVIYFPMEFDFYQIQVISKLRFISDLLFGIAQLWYLIAACLALFLIYYTHRLNNKAKMILACTLLAIAYGLQVGFEMHYIKHSTIKDIYYFSGTSRNFLFYAFPYLLLGVSYPYWLATAKKWKYLLIPLVVLLMAESVFYSTLDGSIFNIFITPLPIALLLFSWVIHSKKQFPYTIPSTLSLGIYVIHFYIVLEVFKKYLDTSYISYYYKFGIVIVLTVLVWFVLDKINKKIPIFF